MTPKEEIKYHEEQIKMLERNYKSDKLNSIMRQCIYCNNIFIEEFNKSIPDFKFCPHCSKNLYNTKEQIKYHEDKIAELKKQLNTCDIKEGELCYFWDSDTRPKRPCTAYFHSKTEKGFFQLSNTTGLPCIEPWEHCEPVIKKYGLKFYVCRNSERHHRNLFLFPYSNNTYEQPHKTEHEQWWNDEGHDANCIEIPSELFPHVKWEDDEPTLIEV